MARIVGVNIPDAKRVEIGLTYIYGIGQCLANRILESVQINPDTRVKDLTPEEVTRISNIIQKNYRIEGDLRKETTDNIRRLIDIKSYRGIRHRRKLPVRGQRTRTNARTKRGARRTVGAVKAEIKMDRERRQKGK